jgi:hypothetical protein
LHRNPARNVIRDESGKFKTGVSVLLRFKQPAARRTAAKAIQPERATSYSDLRSRRVKRVPRRRLARSDEEMDDIK